MPVFRSLRRKARLGRGDVLFASGLTGVSMRYRCRNQCEALAHAGLDCDVVLERETDLDAALGRYRCVVLHRVPWTPQGRTVRRARTAARDAGPLRMPNRDFAIAIDGLVAPLETYLPASLQVVGFVGLDAPAHAARPRRAQMSRAPYSR
ncbi:MAG: hypothetical protein ACJ747_03410 [Gaiellaceae bacterium]